MFAWTTGDSIQSVGVGISAVLLCAAIVQLRAAKQVRQEDLHRSTQRATIDGWRMLAEAIRKGEDSILSHYGRLRMTFDRALSFDSDEKLASQRLAEGSGSADPEDVTRVAAQAALRGVLHDCEAFASACEVGAFDLEIARRLGGWHLAHQYRRSLGFILVMRAADNSDRTFSALERFVVDFLTDVGVGPDDPDWGDALSHAPLVDLRESFLEYRRERGL